MNSLPLPRIALTLGDVAGIGPEVVVRAWSDGRFQECCRPIVVGDPEVVRRAVRLLGMNLLVRSIGHPNEVQTSDQSDSSSIPCWNPSAVEAALVPPGFNDPRAGRAAYAWLEAATHAALAGDVDAITTAPLSKAALHLGGHDYPGHTEILAQLCGVKDFAMMLYLPIQHTEPALATSAPAAVSDVEGKTLDSGSARHGPHAVGVVHVTLHTSLRSVPDLISAPAVHEKILLIDRFLRDIGFSRPRIGVCALNPHAGEEGLFGDEESRHIAPAVASAAAAGVLVVGPLPADTLLSRACAGEFDGVVAMYHDQGHIALKLVGFHRAVNVTLGLPIIRTSPSHGTAFDIAWQGRARSDGFVEAVSLAARLAQSRRKDDPQNELF